MPTQESTLKCGKRSPTVNMQEALSLEVEDHGKEDILFHFSRRFAPRIVYGSGMKAFDEGQKRS